MFIDFPTLARCWAENSPLSVDALLGELVAAFWRGDFDTLGENGGPATALVNRHWTVLRPFEDDYSFADKPYSRLDILQALANPGQRVAQLYPIHTI